MKFLPLNQGVAKLTPAPTAHTTSNF